MASRIVVVWLLIVVASGPVGGLPLTACPMWFWVDEMTLEFRESPATYIPGMSGLLLAVRDVNAQNCSIVDGCKERLRSTQDGSYVNFEHLFYFDNQDLHIKAIPKDVTDCSEAGGDVVIGPVTSAQAAIATHVAVAYDMAVIAPLAIDPRLSDKGLYPNFVRVSPSSELGAIGIALLVKKMGWRQVATLHNTDTSGTGFLEILHDELRGNADDDGDAQDLVTFHDYPLDSIGQSSFNNAVRSIEQLQAKVIVIMLQPILVIKFIQAFEDEGIDLSTYTVIVAEGRLEAMVSMLTVTGNTEGLAAVEGWLTVSHSFDETQWRKWDAHFMEYLTGDEFPHDFAEVYGAAADEEARAEFADFMRAAVVEYRDVFDTSQGRASTYSYDAVWLAAFAAAQAEPGEQGLGLRALHAIRAGRVKPFSGATMSSWSWDSNADPELDNFDLKVKNYARRLPESEAKLHEVASVFTNRTLQFSLGPSIVWPDGTVFPESIPSDGLPEESHSGSRALLLSSVLAAAAVALVIVVSLLFIRRNRKLKKLLALHNEGLATKLELETPAARLYAFLEQLRKQKRYHKLHNEVAKLQTLLVTSDNLRAPDLQQELRSVAQYPSDLADFLLNTAQPQPQLEPSATLDRQVSLLIDNDAVVTIPRRVTYGSSASMDTFLTSLIEPPNEPNLLAMVGRDLLQDTFRLDKLSGSRPLAAACIRIAQDLGLAKPVADVSSKRMISHMSVDGNVANSAIHFGRFYDFITVIESGYIPSVPYHNATHAADVTCRFIALARAMGALDDIKKSASKQRQTVALLVAAAIHDYAHPGTNNSFQIRTRSSYALAFNNQHVLEMHSLCQALELSRREDLNFISDWNDKEQLEFRDTVIDIVLATDMSRHFEIVGAFSSTVVGPSDTAPKTPGRMSTRLKDSSPFSSMDKAHKMQSLRVAIKIADIGHCMSAFDVHYEWSRLLEEEFFRQGDAEKALSLPVSALMDRSEVGCNYPINQMGFLDIIVIPMLESFVKAYPKASILLETAQANRAEWNRRSQL